jgi:hypothetical protein
MKEDPMSSPTSPRPTRFSLACPECHADVSLSARRLLVRVDEGVSASGEVLFTCLACHRTVTVTVDATAVALLVTGGVTHLSLSPLPAPRHPETAVAGPPITHDDLLDLHTRLACDTWIDGLVADDR